MSEEEQRIVDNLIALGALRVSMLSSVIGDGHYVLYTERGPIDIILDDLTKEVTV